MKQGVFSILLILVLFGTLVSAEENITQDFFLGDGSSLIETNIANCTEQLEICLLEYNSLVYEFRNGTNCGGVTALLKNLNGQLGEERDLCNEELEKQNNYRIGFYIFGTLLCIVAIGLFFIARKK